MNTNKLRSFKFRQTKQRQRILELLRSTTSHPTADWLYLRVKKEFPRLSLGTVYRNLKILKAQNIIRELPFGDTFDRFDANTLPHSHFVCRVCGEVCDVHMEQPGEMIVKARVQTGCDIDECNVTFYGVCQRCGKGGGRKPKP